MEDFVRKSYLFDFYGELLTDHQKKIYSEINFEDYSEAEVAREEGISRQGVHDLMKRCDRLLEGYEEKLQLVARFLSIREDIRRIQKLTEPESPESPEARMDGIRQIAAEILEEL